ncbi:MAG: hypothetical protein U0Q12_05310 [Vicinamibacterales bacterium]
MSHTRTGGVKKAVSITRQVIGALLEMRRKPILPHMLNSAGSISAEWYVEALWHYLAKRSLLDRFTSFDVEFQRPARLGDKYVHFVLPHVEQSDVVMDFHVLRPTKGERARGKVPVASIRIHQGASRRRHGVAPDPPLHPYGIEVRSRHLNSRRQVSWYTLVAVVMDVARRGAQLADPTSALDPTFLYIVPRFTFVPLGEATAQTNLFVYPEFSVERPWQAGRSSAEARVVVWAVANDDPWPIAESVVTVVRTAMVDGERRPVDEEGHATSRAPDVATKGKRVS